MDAIASSLEGAVAEAIILVHQIDNLDLKATPSWWELADLTAAQTHTKGGTYTERLGIEEWAEKIGWTEENGKSLKTLKDAVIIARSWPKELRVEGVSFWQHREARDHFDNDVEEASEWLNENAAKKKPVSVRDVTRSGVMGTGPIFDCIRLLMRARRMIVRVPTILADADALGTEPNFDQLRREVNRLKKGMMYLDRYLADETVLDMEEFQKGLDRILKEAAS